MKNFIARIKAFFLLVVTWLNQWAKDHILHFVVADSIATIVWIGTAITLGWMLSPRMANSSRSSRHHCLHHY